MAASEVLGFAKTGGLADVTGSLPQALERRGIQAGLIMPLYRSTLKARPTPVPTDITFSVVVGSRSTGGRIWRSTLPNSRVPVWFVEHRDYFDRDDPSQGRGIYQYCSGNGSRSDYGDNCELFVFFNRAVLEVLPKLDFWPDILHVNDWQTALIPAFLREQYRYRYNGSPRPNYERIRTLLTIHNIAYQGRFPLSDIELTELDWRLYHAGTLEFHGQFCLLKAGILYSDFINTVSPTYAQEIQTEAYGNGLDGILHHSRDRLCGIVNGVDYSVWNPGCDPYLPAPYGAERMEGKQLCKLALQREMGLPESPHSPMCGVVARLAEQKGIDLIAAVVPRMMQAGAQFVLLGEGEKKYHGIFEDFQRQYPDQLRIRLGFDEGLAHRIEAGADFFLMPSAYEPSGLNQLFSLRYGTPPVVRATGGLADTVTDTHIQTLRNQTATGFRFNRYHPDDLWRAIERAIGLYRSYPDEWGRVIRNGMKQDWSWDRSAGEYERLYRRMLQPSRMIDSLMSPK